MTPGLTKAVARLAKAIVQAFVRFQSGSRVRIESLPTYPPEANRSSGREVTKRTGYRLNLGRCLAGEAQLFAPWQEPHMIAAMSRSGFHPGAVVELA